MATAKVLHEYTPEKDDELGLSPGDVLTNVVKHDEGWWEGTAPNGKRGWFPDNFVEEVIAPPPKKAPPARKSQPAKKQAKVLFDYDAENEDELTLKEGQIIDIVNDNEDEVAEGWWMGSIGGKEGMFPNNFVEKIAGDDGAGSAEDDAGVIKAKKVPKMGFGNDIFAGGVPKLKPTASSKQKPPAPASALPPKKSAASAPVGKRKIPAKPVDSRKLLKAIFDYAAQNDDELTLKEGDFVRLDEAGDEGWWQGEVTSSGSKGWFPDNFVEEASADELDAENGRLAAESSTDPEPAAAPPAARPPKPVAAKPAAMKPPAAVKPPAKKPEPSKPVPPKPAAAKPPQKLSKPAPLTSKAKPAAPAPAKSKPTKPKPGPVSSKPKPAAAAAAAAPAAAAAAPAGLSAEDSAKLEEAVAEVAELKAKLKGVEDAAKQAVDDALASMTKKFEAATAENKKRIQDMQDELDEEKKKFMLMKVDLDRLAKKVNS